jgi:hypothetical protein
MLLAILKQRAGRAAHRVALARRCARSSSAARRRARAMDTSGTRRAAGAGRAGKRLEAEA